ncbi:MAG: hypothetical protein GEV06_00050 [Luteitalea sp.]|nr:hypothetical protein [Luteitalea sp.]
MAMMDAFLPEFDREMGLTRRLLERTPLQDGEWTPHQKSRTLRQLASHLADIPRLVVRAMTLSEFDRAAQPPRAPYANVDELLAAFDEQVSASRAAMVGKTDAELLVPWTFKNDGRVIVTQPKIGALRTMFLNHLIHHRGQLTVYLRLQDVPLPSIYGPSADEAV